MISAPHIPENAPFNQAQRSWLNGFLAGMYTGEGDASAAPAAPAIPLTIAFGSQTGTAESLSKKAAKKLNAANFDAKVLDMSELSPADLAEIENLLIITSTYGEGEPPDNAAEFHAALLAEGAPSCAGLNFSVLGLGDSSYPDFCQCSKEIDARLEALGATRIADMVEVDGDPDDDFPKWIAAAQGALGSNETVVEGDASSDEDEDSGYNKKNPFPAPLLKTYNLNAEGSAKATHHVEISLDGSGIDYQVGDALAVFPENPGCLVDEILAAARIAPEETASLEDGTQLSIREALLYHYDVSMLNEAFLVACGRLTKSTELQQLLQSSETVKEYSNGRSLVDAIEDFNVAFPTSDFLLSTLKPLKPRLYSISSSPKAHPGEVHLTVGKVEWESHGRKRLGVCSNYLSAHDTERPVKVYMHSNSAFRLPEDDSSPVIMIGPGTGIAPFRAYLEEREARGASGKNWLFFGDQHEASDFLYRDQIDAWLESGVLNKIDTAFSRDQDEKIYVQNRIIQQAAEFYQWLEEGGSIYICGDASRMAKDVDLAIHKVIELAGGKSEEEAQAYVADLKKSKRYLRDVY